MKKAIVSFVVVVVVLTSILGCAFADEVHCVYPKTVKIVYLDWNNDIVTCIDGAGEVWQFTECDDWCVGDLVSLLMDDNGTQDSIYDDVILMTIYSGFYEDY